MQNYNLIHAVDDVSNPDSLTGTGVLMSQFFPVSVSGIPTITITDLIDANIIGLWREDAPWEQVVGALTNRQYNFDDTTGDFIFSTSLNPSEVIYVLWYTGTAPVTYSEPVTVAEFKIYARYEGFTCSDGSLSEFNYDDTLISETITAARELAEKWCGISIVTKALRAVITNCAGWAEIPQGPVNAISSWKNKDGEDITDYTLNGQKFPQIQSPNLERMVIEYVAGYTNVPKAIKTAILRQTLWMMEHRGDEQEFDLCNSAIYQLSSFTRKTTII